MALRVGRWASRRTGASIYVLKEGIEGGFSVRKIFPRLIAVPIVAELVPDDATLIHGDQASLDDVPSLTHRRRQE
jgi:hypothetical protein